MSDMLPHRARHRCIDRLTRPVPVAAHLCAQMYPMRPVEGAEPAAQTSEQRGAHVFGEMAKRATIASIKSA